MMEDIIDQVSGDEVGVPNKSKIKIALLGDPGLDSSDKPVSNRQVVGAAGALLGAALVVSGIQSGAFENTANAVGGKVATAGEAISSVADGIKITAEGAYDLLGNLIPSTEKSEPRIPNRILIGEVVISPKATFRTSPQVTDGNYEPSNEISREDAHLANEVIVNGKKTYVPVEIKAGEAILDKNPELVTGQYTGGGSGVGEDAPWIQFYTVGGKVVFTDYQKEAKGEGMIEQINHDPLKPVEYATATVIQNAGGVRVVQYDKTLPSEIGHLSAR